MKIVRDGKEYELTPGELAEAKEECMVISMKEDLMNRYGLKDDEKTMEIARDAYFRYLTGDGDTESECVDIAYDMR